MTDVNHITYTLTPISTDPIDSIYQQTPWQPTVYQNASDASDVQKAAAAYDQYYRGSPTVTTGSPPADSPPDPAGNFAAAYVPTLTNAYTQAPDFVPTPPPVTSGAGVGAAIGSSSAFNVDLGQVRGTEQTCLGAASAAIDGYNTLKNDVMPAVQSDNIWGQNVYQSSWVGSVGGSRSWQTNYDPLNKEGDAFAASVNPGMQQLLGQVGGAIEALGQFCALLNNSGQMYTYTDFESSVGPAPEMWQASHIITVVNNELTTPWLTPSG
jgi:hypothetical protein